LLELELLELLECLLEYS